MSEELQKLEFMLELHDRARNRIVPISTLEEVRKFDVGFWVYLVISTHSRIVKQNREIVKYMRKEHGWDKDGVKIQSLIKYLLLFTAEREIPGSAFAQVVESYAALTKERNHLAHNNVDVGDTLFHETWDGKDVADNCRFALQFPQFLHRYAKRHVQRARDK